MFLVAPRPVPTLTHQPARKAWIKLYTTDWRADPGVHMVGLAARGLWVAMLCVMWQSDPVGHLVVAGRPIGPRQLARFTGQTLEDVEAWLTELDEAGVFDRTPDGVIYSRRILRDVARELEDATNGRRGGNPRLTAPRPPRAIVAPPRPVLVASTPAVALAAPDPAPDAAIAAPAAKAIPPKPRPARPRRVQLTEAEAFGQPLPEARERERTPADRLREEFKVALLGVYSRAGAPLPQLELADVWLALGVDTTLCLAVVADIVARKPEASLAYCDAAIRRRMAERGAIPAVVVDPSDPVVDLGNGTRWPRSRILEAVERHRATGRWNPVLGSEPGSPGCRVPRDLLALEPA